MCVSYACVCVCSFFNFVCAAQIVLEGFDMEAASSLVESDLYNRLQLEQQKRRRLEAKLRDLKKTNEDI